MKTDLFDYELPDELIARRPAERRSGSRLLVLRRQNRSVEHRRFEELGEFLSPGDLVVANRSRVFPARIRARRPTGGQVEVLLLAPAAQAGESAGPGERWRALSRPAAKLKEGMELSAPGAVLRVAGRLGEQVLFYIFPQEGLSVLAWAEKHGELPLPPYLGRAEETSDRERYQTVFAREAGSVAAPTAGLHFDDAAIAQLRARGVLFETLRLDVGWGTFAPIRVEDVREHRLEAERYEIGPGLAGEISARRGGAKPGRVVAVGTTVTRSLESAHSVEPPRLSGQAEMYIVPGHGFRAVQALLTNFHLPRTSLLVLVSAFAGREFVLEAYREAVRERYRFYSYGDCMLIL